MKCPECFAEDGHYNEIEDFNPGNEPEWSYYTIWVCHICWNSVNQWEDGFEYGDE